MAIYCFCCLSICISSFSLFFFSNRCRFFLWFNFFFFSNFFYESFSLLLSLFWVCLPINDFTISGWYLAGLFNISWEGFILGYWGCCALGAAFFFFADGGLRTGSVARLADSKVSEIWLCLLTTLRIFSGFFDWQLLMIWARDLPPYLRRILAPIRSYWWEITWSIWLCSEFSLESRFLGSSIYYCSSMKFWRLISSSITYSWLRSYSSFTKFW